MMTFDAETLTFARAIITALTEMEAMVVTAESCTGGLIAAALTAVPGSSDAVFGGYVTYANEAKVDMIGVSEKLIRTHGAVSEEVARAMAEGALETAQTDYAIAVTGIAGPGGGSVEKPVGLVHFGVSGPLNTQHIVMRFGDIGRDDVRNQTVKIALQLLLETIQAGE